MAELIDLKIFSDSRGSLTVVEQVIPFAIKRVFYIYSMDASVRGGHRHSRTIQAVICLKGNCTILSNDGMEKRELLLDHPGKCLFLQPSNWHQIINVSDDAILMVLASELFDPEDLYLCSLSMIEFENLLRLNRPLMDELREAFASVLDSGTFISEIKSRALKMNWPAIAVLHFALV